MRVEMYEDETNQHRLAWLDALKGFGILSVVWLHCYNGYQLSGIESVIIKWITAFHMALFYVAAGYCNTNKKRGLVSTIRKKIKSLLIPYFIWGILIGGLLENIRLIIREGTGQLAGEIKNILLFKTSYLSTWFVFTLFGVYILEACLNKFLNKNSSLPKFRVINIILHVLFLIAGYCLRNISLMQYFRLSKILVASFFFWGGEQLKKYSHSKAIINIPVVVRDIILPGIILAIGTIAALLNNKVTFSEEEYGNPIICLIGAGFIIWGLFMIFETGKGISKNRLLRICGKNSIIILVTHNIFIYGIRLLEILFNMEIHTFPVVPAFIIVITLEVITILYMPRKMLVLFGKRN